MKDERFLMSVNMPFRGESEIGIKFLNSLLCVGTSLLHHSSTRIDI